MVIIEPEAFYLACSLDAWSFTGLTATRACGCCMTRFIMLHSADRARPHGTVRWGQPSKPLSHCVGDLGPLCMAHAAMHASDDSCPPARVLPHALLPQMLPKATQLQNIAQAAVGTCSRVHLLAPPLLVLCARHIHKRCMHQVAAVHRECLS